MGEPIKRDSFNKQHQHRRPLTVMIGHTGQDTLSKASTLFTSNEIIIT